MSVPTDSFAQTSDEKSAGEWHETLPESVGEYLPGSEAEKKLLRKLDMRTSRTSQSFSLKGCASVSPH